MARRPDADRPGTTPATTDRVATASGAGPTAGALLPALAAMLLRALGASWRVHVEGHDPLAAHPASASAERPPAHVGVFWHEAILMATWLYRDRGFSVSVSRSRDGDLISALLLRLGYAAPARGSSSRGGAASLLGLVRRVRSGTTVALVLDGPRGPARKAKPGIGSLGRLAGVPIQPVTFDAAPALRFGSWDRTVLPLPFARVRVRYCAPVRVPPDALDEAATAARVERSMQEGDWRRG